MWGRRCSAAGWAELGFLLVGPHRLTVCGVLAPHAPVRRGRSMGGPALRCAAGKSKRARCFHSVALSRAAFLCEKGVCFFCVMKGVLPREPRKQLRGSLREAVPGR